MKIDHTKDHKGTEDCYNHKECIFWKKEKGRGKFHPPLNNEPQKEWEEEFDEKWSLSQKNTPVYNDFKDFLRQQIEKSRQEVKEEIREKIKSKKINGVYFLDNQVEALKELLK